MKRFITGLLDCLLVNRVSIFFLSFSITYSLYIYLNTHITQRYPPSLYVCVCFLDHFLDLGGQLVVLLAANNDGWWGVVLPLSAFTLPAVCSR